MVLPVGTRFTLSDIKNRDLLNREVETEALRIFNSPKARRDRSLAKIKSDTVQGKTAEIWLSENFNFTLAPDIYHDLIDEDGNYVEVKAYTGISNSENSIWLQDALNRIRNGNWNKSKYLLLFNYNQGEYTFLEKIKIR